MQNKLLQKLQLTELHLIYKFEYVKCEIQLN